MSSPEKEPSSASTPSSGTVVAPPRPLRPQPNHLVRLVDGAEPADPLARTSTSERTLSSSNPALIVGRTKLSDPDLQAAADTISPAMYGRDPEASIDLPPPADVLPPEQRGPNASDPYIGTTFDHRYKIERLLGEGGMGFVYLARHKVIDKRVAVKVLRADLARDREILDRFLQEARAASSIGNPHIVDISDFGDLPDGSTYFVMEFLEGQSLSKLIDSGARLSVERICHIGLQIADGLSAAHACGIVHRDLKPDNVFLVQRGSSADFVKILDFGIAKVSGSTNTKLTKAGAVFGTPHYMSPEQAAGAPVDHRADIYALGVMLYEMVSGQLPFNADNFMGILTQHMYKAPVPIRALVPVPECPPSLEAVVLKCLSKKVEARYQSMDELAADLEKVRAGAIPHAVGEMMARSGGFNVPADYFTQPSVILPATPPSAPKRTPGSLVIFGGVVAVGLVSAVVVLGGTTRGTPPPSRTDAVATAAPSSVSAASLPTVVQASALTPKRVPVAVSAVPLSAVVYRGDQPLHQVPWTVEVDEGKTVAIEIRADGYETEKLILDGSFLSKIVTLKPKKVLRPAAPRPTRPARDSDLVDPWAKH